MTAEDKAKNAGKVALVLEGGSFRGQFTAGVLDVLMEAGVEIPAVYGVSAGALNGVNYKSHQIGRANRINLAFCNDNRFMGVASFASTGSIVGYDFIFNDVQDRLDPFDNETFDASPIEMYAVATDMLFGTATYLPVKSAVLDLDAVRASTSLPLVTPHKIIRHRGNSIGDILKYLKIGIVHIHIFIELCNPKKRTNEDTLYNTVHTNRMDISPLRTKTRFHLYRNASYIVF